MKNQSNVITVNKRDGAPVIARKISTAGKKTGAIAKRPED